MDAIVRADAFNLPFRDESFAVVVADPPYAGKNRGNKGGYNGTGYVPYAGDAWLLEAWRVLEPSGHLYVFATVPEMIRLATKSPLFANPYDILAWFAPNTGSFSGSPLLRQGPRRGSWRPIVDWQKPPAQHFDWRGRPAERNCTVLPGVKSDRIESEGWPNQLPLAVLKWILRPHAGRILDLFSGTGTTRAAAIGLGMPVVSVEMSETALAIIRRRGAQLPVG